MTHDEFWGHIRITHRKTWDLHHDRLVARLERQSVDDLLDFAHWWDVAFEEASFWNMFAAAYLISDERVYAPELHSDFVGWLVLQGRVTFRAAVKNPDSLAEVIKPRNIRTSPDFYRCGWDPVWDAWLTKTRLVPGEGVRDKFEAALMARHPEKIQARPLGRKWNLYDDKQMRRRLPRLWALTQASR